jgi:hypothetical protein
MSERNPKSETELVAFVRAIDEPAPPALRRKIDELFDEHAARPRRGWLSARVPPLLAPPRARVALGATFAFALALALVLAFTLGGAGGAPTLRGAVALTALPATESAPVQSPTHRGQLSVTVEGVAFPYWEDLSWRATGARRDVLGGRPSVTVFYASPHGGTVGYAIVGGAASIVPNTNTIQRGGTSYHLALLDGMHVVAWLRDGRACVLAGRNIRYSTLLRLASWQV